jgi:hypothetical protein
VREGLLGSDSLLRVEHEHVLQEIDGCKGQVLLRVIDGFQLPAGSAFLNLVDKGCRSRLGSDWTNRNVCSGQHSVSTNVRITHVFTADALDHIIRGSTQELGDDGKLVHVVLAGEQGLALQHLGENTASTPDVDLDVVFLPREHNFRRSVVTCRDITRHLGVLYAGKSEVADLEIAVLIDQNVARLQIAVDDSCGVDIFQSALEPSVQPCQLGLRLTRIWYRKY